MNSAQRPEMPADYKPKKPIAYMPIDFELIDGIELLPNDQAGRLFKTLFRYAIDYSETFDASLEPDDNGLNDTAKFMLKLATKSVKERIDGFRITSFKRSGANGGGRPSET